MTGQQITTAAELDALPVGSVVRGDDGHPWEKVGRRTWNTVRSHMNYGPYAAGLLPAVVLDHPDVPAARDQAATDDEREALVEAICTAHVKVYEWPSVLYADKNGTLPIYSPDDEDVPLLADAILAAGFRRQPTPTVTAEWIRAHRFEHYDEHDNHLGACVLVEDLGAALGVQP